jgi:sortase A
MADTVLNRTDNAGRTGAPGSWADAPPQPAGQPGDGSSLPAASPHPGLRSAGISLLLRQAGVSAVYGRVATFGGPFARLAQLQPGSFISVITGQGVSTYTVAAVTDGGQVIYDPWPNRLVLMTASSPVIPSSFIEVDARLAASPRPTPKAAPVISSSELPMAGDHSALALTEVMEWALMLAVAAAGATFAALRWSPWPVYLAAAPLILAVLWNLYQSLAMLLPNLC